VTGTSVPEGEEGSHVPLSCLSVSLVWLLLLLIEFTHDDSVG
jgi:hypothetical protein